VVETELWGRVAGSSQSPPKGGEPHGERWPESSRPGRRNVSAWGAAAPWGGSPDLYHDPN